MALSNFIVTVAGVTAAFILMARTDMRQSAKNLKKNIQYLREAFKQEFPSALKEMEKAKAKELPKK